MNKRKFLIYSAASLAIIRAGSTPALSQGKSTVADNGTEFKWRHENGRLFGTLQAPTTGWIAVGFNETAGLNNMRFIIATVSITPIRVEDHLTHTPLHTNVEELGISTSLANVSGSSNGNRSILNFSLSHHFADRPSLNLSPDAKIHLMLAWSHEVDFDHHSAWRRHYPITI